MTTYDKLYLENRDLLDDTQQIPEEEPSFFDDDEFNQQDEEGLSELKFD